MKSESKKSLKVIKIDKSFSKEDLNSKKGEMNSPNISSIKKSNKNLNVKNKNNENNSTSESKNETSNKTNKKEKKGFFSEKEIEEKKRFSEFIWKIKFGKELNENEKDLIDLKDISGWSPLHWAVNSDDLEKVKWLVSKGADVNALTNHKWTCLHVAVSKSFQNIVSFLLEVNGIKKDLPDIYGKIPKQYVNKSKDIKHLFDKKKNK
eukprot:TRINITY_DN7110_c0_g1_i1.p1 TRINITY_DN7110_c0_g1~~TRINITY_DN7110_c0_g1_i1.p1  ORF type:complete len:230 (-),score=67.57 TRINITY_DN7110_c0_g1_i1:596-1216(-)